MFKGGKKIDDWGIKCWEVKVYLRSGKKSFFLWKTYFLFETSYLLRERTFPRYTLIGFSSLLVAYHKMTNTFSHYSFHFDDMPLIRNTLRELCVHRFDSALIVCLSTSTTCIHTPERKRKIIFQIRVDCRSTKSEKLYPSMLHRNPEPETEPYYCLPIGTVISNWSQPTSPAPGSARTFPLSPTHTTPRHSIPKNDDSVYFLMKFDNCFSLLLMDRHKCMAQLSSNCNWKYI